MRPPVFILCSILAATLMHCSSPKSSAGGSKAPKKLRTCPDEWIINNMPRMVQPGQEGKAEEYFILGGKRYEKEAFDLEWVKANCQLSPTVVH